MKGRAGDETRTRDIFLGKEVLYQLSYTREAKVKYEKPGRACQSPSLPTPASDPQKSTPFSVPSLGSRGDPDRWKARSP